MKYELKSKSTPTSSKEYLQMLQDMANEGYIWQQNYKDISIFYKTVTVRKTKSKEPQKPITTYFSEQTVKGLCTFYKDLEELYFDWVKVRADCGKFATFTNVAEKSAWKKLGSVPKLVARQMIDNAGASCYGKIYDLQEYEIEKIMTPVREERRIEQAKETGFKDEEEKQTAELEKARIEGVIKNNPQLEIEARNHVLEKFPNLAPQMQDKMIKTRTAMLGKNFN